jgi:ethanolamine permease
LQTGTLGWLQIAALGVAIAISGNFSGWNYGLSVGGWGGMLAAACLMAVLYLGLTQIVGELAATLPRQSGFDQYVAEAFGPRAGAVAGMALFAGLAVGTGLAASFISAYLQSVAGIGGWPLKIALVVVVALLQARGASDSVRATVITGAIALVVLLLFCFALAPDFAFARLFSPGSGAAPTLFPDGLAGVFSCVPFALFFFIGVEQAALGAAEAKDAARTVPRALIAAVITALVVGFSVLIIGTGAAGAAVLARSDDPLYTAVSGAARLTTLGGIAPHLIAIGATVSLLATFFSLSYAASRQAYALAGAGELPRWLTHTNRKHAPDAAVAVVALVGLVAAAFEPNTVMVLFVFLLNIAYQMVIAAYCRLKTRQAAPGVFRAFGGRWTAGVSSVLSLIVLISCLHQEPRVNSLAAVLLFLYFAVTRLARGATAVGL